ncbi:MAG: PQQ-binding-like beta-propeller repeat protein [Verrucomicrobiales bacterium]
MVGAFGWQLQSAELAADRWPIVRGDSALRGVATSPVGLPLKLAWSYAAGKPILATPITDGDAVYFGDGEGRFHAVSLAGGKGRWQVALMDAKKGKPSGDPIEGSACLASGHVIFGGSDSSVRALGVTDGKEKWQFDAQQEIKAGATPFLRRTPEGREQMCVVIAGFGGGVFCLDATTGQKIWEYDAGGPINGAVAVSGVGVVLGGCNGTIDVLDPASGQRRHRVDIKIYMPNSVAILGEIGYFGHSGNKVEAWNLKEPKQVWEFRDRDFAYFTSPAVTEEFVFIGGEDKRLHCLTRSGGEEKWSFRARDKINSSPVVAGGLVIVGADDGRLYAVDALNGQERWSYEVGSPIKSSPAVASGHVLIGTEDGQVHCFTGSEK